MEEARTLIEEKLITGEELYRMPDLGRCELVEGRIVMLSPTGFISIALLNLTLG